MKLNEELAIKIVTFLNELNEIDNAALNALFNNRVPCNNELAEHPTVQVGQDHTVGILGLLNGLCGTDENGNGPIVGMFDQTDDGLVLLDFQLMKDYNANRNS